MFLAILFLVLAVLASTLFPEWSWATVLAVSFACVAIFRLVLFFTGRKTQTLAKDDPS